MKVKSGEYICTECSAKLSKQAGSMVLPGSLTLDEIKEKIPAAYIPVVKATVPQKCDAKTDENAEQKTDENVGTEIINMSGGCLGTILLVIGGIALSATGIGALIGIPMIIKGVILPFQKIPHLKGSCPWCSNEIISNIKNKATTCGVCKKRVLIQDNQFVKIEE